jgi:predicted metal-dependent peptidase
MADVKKKTSRRSAEDITQELMAAEFVLEEKKKHDLQNSIFHLNRSHPFFGAVMQCMNIAYVHTLPTAGVSFNNDLKRWDLHINPHFFCNKLNDDHRKAILLHEVYHITHKHPFRLPFIVMPDDKRMLMNVAADMAINQLIQGLPNGCPECPKQGPCKNVKCPGKCIDVKDYYDVDEQNNITKWPRGQTTEFYFEKLLSTIDDSENDQDGFGISIDGDGEGQGDGKGKPGKGGKGKNKAKVKGSYGPLSQDTIDSHDWDANGSEKDMLDAAEDLIKRAMIKQSFDHSQLPDSVKDLLQDIKARRAELNYRQIILSAMKASLPSNTRENSWTRKSRRFGNKAPGTRIGSQPRLEIFIDTSGSISVEEANEFLGIVDEFLKVGARECNLNMFHTRNYYHDKYKMGTKVTRDKFQSGGTDLTDSLKLVAKKRPDLTIFLTDGYYEDVKVESMIGPGEKFPKTVFIISKQGQENHPFNKRDWARTVKIPGERTR